MAEKVQVSNKDLFFKILDHVLSTQHNVSLTEILDKWCLILVTIRDLHCQIHYDACELKCMKSLLNFDEILQSFTVDNTSKEENDDVDDKKKKKYN